ncbi:MAG: T9SS type A sorting domain-containing protein [Chitinophagaceae bacterium]|nr:T9SS type A sorting domain-containing protein [Chitinophagaceae bacterium]
MKKIYVLIFLIFGSVVVWGQTSYTSTAVGTAWNALRWNNAADAPPYTSTFTANNIASFTSGTYSFAGMGAAVNVGNIIVASGVTVNFVSIGSTFGTGGLVRTIDVGAGGLFDFNAQAISVAGGTGFIKNGTGVFATGGGTYTGGFVINAGTVIARGTTGFGSGGANFLTLNGGTLAANGNRAFANTRFPGGITIGGDIQLGEIPANVALASNIANLQFDNNVSLGASTRTITLGNAGTNTFTGIISNTSGGLTIAANANGTTGSVIISGANTYTGATTITGGTLTTGAANTIPLGATMTLGGGTLRTGTGAGFTQSTGTLNLSANSTITLGTGVHTLSFANSSAVPWTAGQTLTITGWAGGYNGTSGTAGQIFVGADATGLTAGQLAQITFRDGSNNPFPAVILATGEVVPGAAISVPDIALSSPNPAVAAGNIVQGSSNNVIYRFDLAVTTANAALTGVTITTAGTYAVTDFTNFRCWYSADNIFDAGTDVLLSTITPAVAGAQAFTPFTNQTINNGSTGFIFITATVPCTAVLSNTISVNAITTADITFTSGNKTGTAFAGDAQTIIAGSPNDVTIPGASVANLSSSLSWVTPTGCFDEILIVARATSANDGTPTGDGTAYTANAAYGSGTGLGSGFVVYKGPSTSPQPVTGLTNGTPYFYKFFTRSGTTWSAGVEVSATPAVVSVATDYYRSVAPGGPWGSTGTWESSSDNATWIAATLVPTAAANTITIRNTANVTVAAAAGGDQVVVDAGASLILNANFTLADGAGTDLVVNGTVTNLLGTFTFTGTAAFNAGSVYQHNRNGSPVLTATWDPASTVEINGIAGTQPTGLGQTFGHFTWNSTGQTGNIGLGNPAGFAIAGNLTVTSTGGVTNRAFRFTSNTAYTLSVGGNLILNGGHLGLSSGSGTMALTVAGDVSVSNNSELYMSQTGSGASTLNIGGNLSVSTGTITETGSSTASLIVFNKAGTQTFSATAAVLSNDLNYIIFTGSTLVLNNSLPVNTGRLFTVDGTLDCGILSVNGTGAVTVSNGGRIRLGSLNAADAVADNISASGGLTLNTGSTVEFNGLAAQFAAARTFSIAEINNINGVTLTGAVLVTDVLGLTNGIITTTAANLLTMGVASSYTGGNSNASYVNGPVKKIGNTAFIFPVGKANGYVPIGVSNFAGASAPTDEFTAEYIRASGAALGANAAIPAVNRISACEYWTLDAIGTPTVDLTLYWNANNPCNGTYISNVADIEVVHFNGTNWNTSSVGFSSKTGTPAAGDITWTNVSTFSPFTLASSSAANPLPITINYFNGTRSNGNHLLNWKVTCISTPSATIEIERSADGQNYSSIYSIVATAVRCQQPFNYTDNQPVKGINYYRLKMTDVDGKITYSTTVTLINAVKGIDVMNIAPNPIVNGAFNVKISTAEKTPMELVITDMQGRILQKQAVNMIAGFNQVPMNVQNLAAGTYQLFGHSADGRTRVLRFVIQ